MILSTSTPRVPCQTALSSTSPTTGASELRRLLSTCSFEDDALTLEELRERISAEVTLYQNLRRVPHGDDNGSSTVVGNMPRKLQSTLSLQHIILAVASQAREESEGGGDKRAGEGVEMRPNAGKPLENGVLDTRFSSMANIADAENGTTVDGLDGSEWMMVHSDRGKVEEPFVNPEVHSKGDGFGDERKDPGLTTPEDARGVVQLDGVTDCAVEADGGDDGSVDAGAGVLASGRVETIIDETKIVEKGEAEEDRTAGVLPEADRRDDKQCAPQGKQHGSVEEARLPVEIVQVERLDARAKSVDRREQEDSTLKPVTARLEGVDPEDEAHEKRPSKSPTAAVVTEGSGGEGGGENGGGMLQNSQGGGAVDHEVDARCEGGNSLEETAVKGDSLTVASTALAFDGGVLERSQDPPSDGVLPPPAEVLDDTKAEEETGASRVTEKQVLGLDVKAASTESGKAERHLGTPVGDVRGPNNPGNQGGGVILLLDDEQGDGESPAGKAPPGDNEDGGGESQEDPSDARTAAAEAGVPADGSGAVRTGVDRDYIRGSLATGTGALCPSDQAESPGHAPMPDVTQNHGQMLRAETVPESDDESPGISRQALPHTETECGQGGGGKSEEESSEVDLFGEAQGLRSEIVVGFDAQGMTEKGGVPANARFEIVLPGDNNNRGRAESARDVTRDDDTTTVGEKAQEMDEERYQKRDSPEVSTDAARERDRHVGRVDEDKAEDAGSRTPAEQDVGPRGREVTGGKATEACDVSPLGMEIANPGEEKGRTDGDGFAHEAANGNGLLAATPTLRTDKQFVEEQSERTAATEVPTACDDACRQRPIHGTESTANGGVTPREPLLSLSRLPRDGSDRETLQVSGRAVAASSTSDDIEETVCENDASDGPTKIAGVATAHNELDIVGTRKPSEPSGGRAIAVAGGAACDAVRQQSGNVSVSTNGPASADVACYDRDYPGELVEEEDEKAHPLGICTPREDDCPMSAVKRDNSDLTAGFVVQGATACGVQGQPRPETSTARGGTDDAPRELPPIAVEQEHLPGRPVEERIHSPDTGMCTKGTAAQEVDESGGGPAKVSPVDAAAVLGSMEGVAGEKEPERRWETEISGCREGGMIEQSNLREDSSTCSTGLRIAGGDAISEEEKRTASKDGTDPKEKEEEVCTRCHRNEENDSSPVGSTNVTEGDIHQGDASGRESAVSAGNDAEEPLNDETQPPPATQGEPPAGEPLSTTVNTASEDPARNITGSRASNGQQKGKQLRHDDQNGAAESRRSVGLMDPNVAATRIQATCRRRAACRKVRRRREADARCSTRHTATSERATSKQRCLRQRRSDEQERAATTIQATQCRALAIQRTRTLHSQCSDDKKLLFGPSTTPTNPARTGDNRTLPPLLTDDDTGEREEQKKMKAAVKIQAQARRRAASRRVASAAAAEGAELRKGNRRSRGDSTIDSRTSKASQTSSKHVPKLPITSVGATAGKRRVPPKVHTEPLAILRQLRDRPQSKPKPKEDNFTLRVTIRSAIEAHVRKTGATRRKARPLPTPPRWTPMTATVKFKTPRRGQTSRMPLVKPRVFSPLHKSVEHVNSTILARKKRKGRSAGPSRVHERLYCALFAAERSAESEYVPARRGGDEKGGGKRKMGGGGEIMEDSSGVIRAPQLVRCGPPPA